MGAGAAEAGSKISRTCRASARAACNCLAHATYRSRAHAVPSPWVHQGSAGQVRAKGEAACSRNISLTYTLPAVWLPGGGRDPLRRIVSLA